VRGRVTAHEQLAPDIHSFWLKAPSIARTIQPGQFVQVRVRDGFEPFLRRPISIAQREKDGIRLVFRVAGAGTRLMAATRGGDEWNLLGPLGRPAPKLKNRKVILVGGGIGIPPLLFLAERAIRDNQITVLLGARSRSGMILQSEFRRLRVNCLRTATDDGSLGRHGLVTDLLAEAMHDTRDPSVVVLACGPRAMLRRVKELTGEVEAYAFWEEHMGCGTGICYGCAVKSTQSERYIRFCQDGPVLNLKEIEV
jgi:dihydroorotate dehydrogenase electron transfer subunit